eukprot:gb/GECG01002258.1/.p1 GENE.gb/GECG01002258.1/~~gb/GECG01002258.1/.p1  ORF type:complete len:1576 (+),score=233.86 gb/GECG01002258.1/:1-4728(+)
MTDLNGGAWADMIDEDELAVSDEEEEEETEESAGTGDQTQFFGGSFGSRSPGRGAPGGAPGGKRGGRGGPPHKQEQGALEMPWQDLKQQFAGGKGGRKPKAGGGQSNKTSGEASASIEQGLKKAAQQLEQKNRGNSGGAASSFWQQKQQSAVEAANAGEYVKMGTLNTWKDTSSRKNHGRDNTEADQAKSWPRGGRAAGNETQTAEPPSGSWRGRAPPSVKSTAEPPSVQQRNVNKSAQDNKASTSAPDPWDLLGARRKAATQHLGVVSAVTAHGIEIKTLEGKLFSCEEIRNKQDFSQGTEVRFMVDLEDEKVHDVRIVPFGTVEFIEISSKWYVGVVLNVPKEGNQEDSVVEKARRKATSLAWDGGAIKPAAPTAQSKRSNPSLNVYWATGKGDLSPSKDKGQVEVLGDYSSDLADSLFDPTGRSKDTGASGSKGTRLQFGSGDLAKDAAQFDATSGIEDVHRGVGVGDIVKFRIALDKRSGRSWACGICQLTSFNVMVNAAKALCRDKESPGELPSWQRYGLVTNLGDGNEYSVEVQARDGNHYLIPHPHFVQRVWRSLQTRASGVPEPAQGFPLKVGDIIRFSSVVLPPFKASNGVPGLSWAGVQSMVQDSITAGRGTASNSGERHLVSVEPVSGQDRVIHKVGVAYHIPALLLSVGEHDYGLGLPVKYVQVGWSTASSSLEDRNNMSAREVAEVQRVVNLQINRRSNGNYILTTISLSDVLLPGMMNRPKSFSLKQGDIIDVDVTFDLFSHTFGVSKAIFKQATPLFREIGVVRTTVENKPHEPKAHFGFIRSFRNERMKLKDGVPEPYDVYFHFDDVMDPDERPHLFSGDIVAYDPEIDLRPKNSASKVVDDTTPVALRGTRVMCICPARDPRGQNHHKSGFTIAEGVSAKLRKNDVDGSMEADIRPERNLLSRVLFSLGIDGVPKYRYSTEIHKKIESLFYGWSSLVAEMGFDGFNKQGERDSSSNPISSAGEGTGDIIELNKVFKKDEYLLTGLGGPGALSALSQSVSPCVSVALSRMGLPELAQYLNNLYQGVSHKPCPFRLGKPEYDALKRCIDKKSPSEVRESPISDDIPKTLRWVIDAYCNEQCDVKFVGGSVEKPFGTILLAPKSHERNGETQTDLQQVIDDNNNGLIGAAAREYSTIAEGVPMPEVVTWLSGATTLRIPVSNKKVHNFGKSSSSYTVHIKRNTNTGSIEADVVSSGHTAPGNTVQPHSEQNFSKHVAVGKWADADEWEMPKHSKNKLEKGEIVSLDPKSGGAFIKAAQDKKRLFCSDADVSGDLRSFPIGTLVEFERITDRLRGSNRQRAANVRMCSQREQTNSGSGKAESGSVKILTSSESKRGTNVIRGVVCKELTESKGGMVGEIEPRSLQASVAGDKELAETIVSHRAMLNFDKSVEVGTASAQRMQPTGLLVGDEVDVSLTRDSKDSGKLSTKKITLTHPNEGRVSGTVVTKKDGFGFIAPHKRGEPSNNIYFNMKDLWTSLSGMVQKSSSDHRAAISEGDEVEYSMVTRDGRKSAIRVTPLGKKAASSNRERVGSTGSESRRGRGGRRRPNRSRGKGNISKGETK